MYGGYLSRRNGIQYTCAYVRTYVRTDSYCEIKFYIFLLIIFIPTNKTTQRESIKQAQHTYIQIQSKRLCYNIIMLWTYGIDKNKTHNSESQGQEESQQCDH